MIAVKAVVAVAAIEDVVAVAAAQDVVVAASDQSIISLVAVSDNRNFSPVDERIISVAAKETNVLDVVGVEPLGTAEVGVVLIVDLNLSVVVADLNFVRRIGTFIRQRAGVQRQQRVGGKHLARFKRLVVQPAGISFLHGTLLN